MWTPKTLEAALFDRRFGLMFEPLMFSWSLKFFTLSEGFSFDKNKFSVQCWILRRFQTKAKEQNTKLRICFMQYFRSFNKNFCDA